MPHDSNNLAFARHIVQEQGATRHEPKEKHVGRTNSIGGRQFKTR